MLTPNPRPFLFVRALTAARAETAAAAARAGHRVFFVPRARKTRVLPSRRVPRRVALGAAAQTLVVVRVGVPGQKVERTRVGDPARVQALDGPVESLALGEVELL